MAKRTDLKIIEDGDFAKIGRKHFQHISGQEIRYDGNAWGWRAVGKLWPSLDVAVWNVRFDADMNVMSRRLMGLGA